MASRTFAIPNPGPLPGAVIFGVMCTVYAAVLWGVSSDPTVDSLGLWIATLILGAVAAFIGLFVFHSRGTALEITETQLLLKAPFYGRCVPLTALDSAALKTLDLTTDRDRDFKPKWRTNGIGLPRLQLGWFKLKNNEKAWCYITDPTAVAYLPTTEGYAVMVSIKDIPGLKTALTA
ncbi:MAG: PH domain-containing protein [Rhodospirillaceae bacterium]